MSSRKDYVAVAEILVEEISDATLRAALAKRFATHFRFTNPRFQPETFYRAAKVIHE